jgi:acetyl-CoA C-acetyltransferase
MNDAPTRGDWSAGAQAALVETFDDVCLAGGARTPFVDYNGALAQVSATDLGIHAARAALARSGIDPAAIGATFAGSCAQSSFDAYYLPRQIGLYAGVPADRPALGVHRLCTTGFEAIAQAARGIGAGMLRAALCAGAESMSRNPVAAYTHRGGFRMGKVEFADFLWESTLDTSVGIRMGDTAENLAAAFGITRAETDAYAARSFARAIAAQQDGRFAAEIVPIEATAFDAPGCAPRGIRLPRGVTCIEHDSHVRPTGTAVLAKLPAAFGGVQTGGNSSAIVDGAAATVAGRRAVLGATPLCRVLAVATAAVAPEVMGIGPVPAITALLHRTGRTIGDIALLEVNEAFGAQAEAVRRALDVTEDRWNVNGGAIAFGHPLAATGIRCVLSLALELRRRGGGLGIAAACAGGGQGMAVLIEA